MAAVLAALDIGGTKIAGGLVGADGDLLHRYELPTPADDPIRAVHAILRQLAEHPLWTRVAAIGIGCAGPVDPVRGTVSPVNIPAWRDFPLTRAVAEATGLPVALSG